MGVEQYVNGELSESIAVEIIEDIFEKPDIEVISSIIDLCVDGKFVEVKSCSEYVRDRSHKNNRRRGRFIISKSQHDFLVKNNGSYLFIVRLDRGGCFFRFVKASKLDIVFKSERTSICWKKIFI